MRRLKALWYSFDPYPIGWRATLRFGLILWVGECVAAYALMQIINAILS